MELLSDDAPAPKREEHEDFENLWLAPKEAERLLTYDDGRDVLSRAMETIKRMGGSKLIH